MNQGGRDTPFWEWLPGQGPLVATAVHDGHRLSPRVAQAMALDEAERFREEDPYTASWAGLLPQCIRTGYSRFEVDLNRPRDKAVYRLPEDCWGLEVWRGEAPAECREDSLRRYDDFYAGVEAGLREIENRHGVFVLLDIHSYNHRREGPEAPAADPEANPEINIGSESCDRNLWGPLIEGFISDLRNFDFFGRSLDVRENVKFKGGYFPRWVNRRFPATGCALALEFKKIFMDEWTGELNQALHRSLGEALAATLPGLRSALRERGGRA